MASFWKRKGKRGVRWTARVRIKGRKVTRTWSTLAAAEAWARAQETAIDDGKYLAPQPGSGRIFADGSMTFASTVSASSARPARRSITH